MPLTLAAAAVAAGFLSFLPTDYRGVSELGQIAGVGMLIAYLTSITLLPALITVLNPPGEPEPVGYRVLAPVDRFPADVIASRSSPERLRSRCWVRRCCTISPSTSTRSICAARRRNRSRPCSISAATRASASIQSILVMPSLDEAAAAAERLQQAAGGLAASRRCELRAAGSGQEARAHPGISAEDRADAAAAEHGKPPSDAENVAALNGLADQLNKLAGNASGPGADAAKRLAADACKLAHADEAQRGKAQTAFIVPLKTDLAQLREFLQAKPVTQRQSAAVAQAPLADA